MLKLLTVMLARTCPKATLVIKVICNRPSALCRSIIICDAISDVLKRIMQFFGGVNNTPVFLPFIFIPALLLAESIVFDIQYCCKTHAVVFIPFLVIRKGNLTSEILIFIFCFLSIYYIWDAFWDLSLVHMDHFCRTLQSAWNHSFWRPRFVPRISFYVTENVNGFLAKQLVTHGTQRDVARSPGQLIFTLTLVFMYNHDRECYAILNSAHLRKHALVMITCFLNDQISKYITWKLIWHIVYIFYEWRPKSGILSQPKILH